MKKTLIVLLLFPIALVAQSNKHATGCLIDDEAYSRIPVKVTQLTRSYTALPVRASLVQYCPTPGDQGMYETCTSWAIAYAARTIMEAQINGTTDTETNTKEAFSPTFVYALIKESYDRGCNTGTYINKGLDLLKRQGVPKKKTYYEDCATSVPSNAYTEAANFKIQDYFTLFTVNDNAAKRVEATKMAISEGRPVIISMVSYESFHYAKECWNGKTNNSNKYHAMCVVGYDDELYGGAFKIMNSWGTYWGDKGFTWITYKDYGIHVQYGYEMYLGKKKASNETTFAGSFDIKLATGGTMSVSLCNDQNTRIYKVAKAYPSGTRYRVMLSNNEPAYVYVLGSDQTGRPEVLFPPTPKVSPALVYASNNIAIPDEQWYIETDNTVGTDYLCVLYSQTELPIYEIASSISSSSGPFVQRVNTVLGDMRVLDNEISFGNSKISFSSSSKRTVVPIFVEIPHSR